jgi:hypothetical protein
MFGVLKLRKKNYIGLARTVYIHLRIKKLALTALLLYPQIPESFFSRKVVWKDCA